MHSLPHSNRRAGQGRQGGSAAGERLFYLKATLLLFIAWVAVFELVGNVAKNLPTVDLTLPLDRRIPFVAAFVWPYILCHVWAFLMIVALKDFHRANRAFLAVLLSNLTAYLVYILVPVAFPRPELGPGLSDQILAWYHRLDFYPGANKLPSNHVAFIWIIATACRRQRFGRIGDLLLPLGASLITVATLFVKQHVVLDAALGMVWGFAAWFAAGRLYPAIVDPSVAPADGLKRLVHKVGPATLAYLAILLGIAAFVLGGWPPGRH